MYTLDIIELFLLCISAVLQGILLAVNRKKYD